MVEVEPLAARKASSACRSVSSLGSYPLIPLRRSSLSASTSSGSTGRATSTRTPSLSDSRYQIEVPKLRMNAGALGCNQLTHSAFSENPFLDDIPRSLSGPHQFLNKTLLRQGTQLTVRWSSGSWAEGSSRPSGSSSASFGRPSTPGPKHASFMQAGQQRSSFLSPLDLPLSFADVKTSISKTQIGLEPTSLWTSVHVSADVTSLEFPGVSGLAPLDMIILLDSLPHPSVDILTQVTLACSVLASNMILDHDRIGLTCVDEQAQSSLKILLPLGFHSLDTVRLALNSFSRRQRSTNPTSTPELGEVIQEAAALFSKSTRTAFCHIMFMSASPPQLLVVPWIDRAIGVHTITPQTRFQLHHMNHQPGWHISYDVGADSACPKGTHFIRKVSRTVRHLRTGIRPGHVYDLKLSLIPAEGCSIQFDKDDTRLDSLRGGEVWVVPVQINVPAVFPATSFEIKQPDTHDYCPLVRDLITRINDVLMEYTPEITQPILTAHVEYQHSLLPPSNIIHMKSHLAVVRGERPVLGHSGSTDEGSEY